MPLQILLAPDARLGDELQLSFLQILPTLAKLPPLNLLLSDATILLTPNGHEDHCFAAAETIPWDEDHGKPGAIPLESASRTILCGISHSVL